MKLQLYCLVDKCHWSDESTQLFVVSPTLDDAVNAFKDSIAAPHSKYNWDTAPAQVETLLELEMSSKSGQWDKVGYLNVRINENIPKKLPVFVRTFQPNAVFV